MDVIYLLIPIAIVLVCIAVGVFLWAVKSDQFEDMEGPAHSILFDDDDPPAASQANSARGKTDPDTRTDA